MSQQHKQRIPESQNQPASDGLIEVQPFQRPSAEAEEIAAFFLDLERKQIDFLNEAGKSLIERTATFLAILLGASVLSNNFPPAYLQGDQIARWATLLALGCYLCAVGVAMWGIQPRFYRRYLSNMSALERVRDTMLKRKMHFLRLASIGFFLGTLCLAVLIVEIVWKLTQ